MKLIVAGSRSLNLTIKQLINIIKIRKLFKEFKYPVITITEIVSGGARGIDKLGETWAAYFNIPIKRFIPDWDNLDVPGAIIKTNKYGKKYNAKAGHDRNMKMAEYGDAAIIIWDGKSKGSADMIQCMQIVGKSYYVKVILNEKTTNRNI